MKNLGFVCLAVVLAVSTAVPASAAEELSPFTLAQRVGEPHLRYMHSFTTSVGKYTIRQDGFGEVYMAGGGRKKHFHLKPSPRIRIEWVYFYEYDGDLLLLYRTTDSGYFVRLDQKTRKIKRATVVNHDVEPPIIRERSAVFDDGTVVPLS